MKETMNNTVTHQELGTVIASMVRRHGAARTERAVAEIMHTCPEAVTVCEDGELDLGWGIITDDTVIALALGEAL